MAFGYLDVLLAGETLRQLWTIRFGVGLPTAIACVALSYVPAARSAYHVVLTPAALACGASIIAMVAVNDPPASEYYYAGIVIVLFFTYTFIQLPVVYATLVGCLCLIGYEIVAIVANQSPFEVIINNTFFLMAANYVGIFAGYSLERSRRKDFLHLTVIEADHAQLEKLSAELVELSTQDPLTGLLNRRQLSEHLQDEVDRYHADGTTAAAMLIDLDDFKAVNDQYGHLAGDDLLRRTARAIASTVRRGDLTFRYGGDEFFVLLPDTTLEEAQKLAHRMVDRFQGFGSASAGSDDAPRISIGVAALDHSTPSPDDLLNAADRALYEAKEGGKGRVAVVRSGPPSRRPP
jgi:diguanylate cyclase (GGDEF)-like protein